MEARHAACPRLRRSSRASPSDMGVTAVPRPDARFRARLRRSPADLLDRRVSSSDATASSSRSRSPTTPSSRAPRMDPAAAPHATGPSAARPTPPAPCSRPTSRRSSRAARLRRAVRADRSANRSPASARPGTTCCSTSSTTCRSRLYVMTHKDGRWLREPLPGVPEFGDVSAHASTPTIRTTTSWTTPIS